MTTRICLFHCGDKQPANDPPPVLTRITILRENEKKNTWNKKKVFGMHENANITCAIAETEMSFSIVLSMQPRTGGGGGASREDLIGGIAKDMEDR